MREIRFCPIKTPDYGHGAARQGKDTASYGKLTTRQVRVEPIRLLENEKQPIKWKKILRSRHGTVTALTCRSRDTLIRNLLYTCTNQEG